MWQLHIIQQCNTKHNNSDAIRWSAFLIHFIRVRLCCRSIVMFWNYFSHSEWTQRRVWQIELLWRSGCNTIAFHSKLVQSNCKCLQFFYRILNGTAQCDKFFVVRKISPPISHNKWSVKVDLNSVVVNNLVVHFDARKMEIENRKSTIVSKQIDAKLDEMEWIKWMIRW